MLACQHTSQPATTRIKLKKGKNSIIKHSTPSSAMPDLPPKKWGALQDLIDDGAVDVNDLSTRMIDAIHDEYFCHREKKNFRRNFRDFVAANALKTEYSGAKRRQRGELSRYLSIFYYIILTPTPSTLSRPQRSP